MSSIRLPWPAKELWPNRKAHWAAKSAKAKTARTNAFYLMKAHKLMVPPEAELTITFHPPTNRRVDIDNCLATQKSALDGLADASGVDDEGWSYRVRKGKPVSDGCVLVEWEGDEIEQESSDEYGEAEETA